MFHSDIFVLKGGTCMKRIIEEVFKRKKIVVTLFILLLCYGIYAYIFIPKQEMPEIDPPYMVLQITAPSMSAVISSVEFPGFLWFGRWLIHRILLHVRKYLKESHDRRR